MFVIDTTGSMGGDITGVKDNLSVFVDTIVEAGVDVRFAVIEYQDITVDGLESTVIYTFGDDGNFWTAKSSDVSEALTELVSHVLKGAGGDGPETPTDAFAKMFDKMSFRPDASTFAFLLTDASAKGNGDPVWPIDETSSDDLIVPMAEIVDSLATYPIRTSVVSKTYWEDHYRSLFETTGGIFIDIDTDFADTMLELAKMVAETVKLAASMDVAVLERGRPTDGYSKYSLRAAGIIGGISSSGAYVDSSGNPVTEASLSSLGDVFTKSGFTADGNTRLILRAKTTKSGTVTFTIPEELGGTLENLARSMKSSTTVSVATTEVDDEKYPYQASAVLIAPKDYPYPDRWPSATFSVGISFTDPEGDKLETSKGLFVQAVPVVLIHGFTRGSTVVSTFGNKHTDKGIRGKLNEAGMKNFVFECNYNGAYGPRTNIPLNTENTQIFQQIATAIRSVYLNKIACTRVDLIGYSMGGLIARRFIQDDKSNLTTPMAYGQGTVHRLITVATPHAGSPLASYMMNPLFEPMRDIVDSTITLTGTDRLIFALLGAARLTVHSVYNIFNGNNDDALKDLMLNSNLITSLGKPSVPIHSLYGDITLKSLLGEGAKTLYDIDGFRDGLPPLFGILFRVMPYLLDSAPNALAIERIFYGSEGHDLVVGTDSATAASSEVTKHTGWDYRHTNICKMDDVGEEVVELLKATEASFDVTGASVVASSKVRSSAPVMIADGDTDSLDPDKYFVEKLTLSADAGTATTDGSVTVVTLDGARAITFTATAENTLSFNVYLQAEGAGESKLYRMTSDDTKKIFTYTPENFAEGDTVELSCFSQGNDDNVYVSNTLRVVVKPKLEEEEIAASTLSFINAPDISYREKVIEEGRVKFKMNSTPGVIYTNVNGETPAGLYLTTAAGDMYDVSSPAMGTTWTEDEFAEVTDQGMIRGLKEGTTTLTAKFGSLTKSISVDVGAQLVVASDVDVDDAEELGEEEEEEETSESTLRSSGAGCGVGFAGLALLSLLSLLIVKK
ncbi:MAG: hypothetical protein IJP91_02710 [Synergistaceae bacterium]|nr:hypothetical protein [Synergistaceae bacterium]